MKSRLAIIAGFVVVGSLVTVAYLRSGFLNLPSVPDDLRAEDAGLSGLESMRWEDKAISTGNDTGGKADAVSLASFAVAEIRKGEHEKGIKDLEQAVHLDPADLVIGNTLRMEILMLKRQWLQKEAEKSEIDFAFPEYLRDEPIGFFRKLAREHPLREVKLQLSLTLVDHMLLFPALEIKAPASVEAVEILTEVLSGSAPSSAYYVPALYARGLNYLYRPFNLVWPEKIAAAPDAASNDLSLCVAVGQQVGVGSSALRAELALALGDAYGKERRYSSARSWWQLANNVARDDRFRERVFSRLKWNDDQVLSNLEEKLQRQMEDLEHPLSDLRFMWQ